MKPIVLERQAASSVWLIVAMSRPPTDDPPPRRLVDPGDQVQQRRLAGARGPHQRDVLAVRDVQVEALEDRDLDRVPAVHLLEVLDANQRLRHGLSYFSAFDSNPVSVLEHDPAGERRQPLAALQPLLDLQLSLDVARPPSRA